MRMRPKIQGLCPQIQVHDLAKSLAFYQGLIGFRVEQQSASEEDRQWVWLKLGDAQLMLNTGNGAAPRPLSPDPSRVLAHDDTCFYFGTPDVDGMYEYLRSRGVAVTAPTIAPHGMKQLFLADPDGYGVCFQWPDVHDYWI